MQRNQKEDFVSHMSGQITDAAGVLFVDDTGLTVNDANAVRGKLREAGVGYQVVKNTLMTRVLVGASCEAASACLKGSPTGVIIGHDDPVAAAKLAFDLGDDYPVKVKGGILDGQALDAAGAKALSKMPSKQELQATVVGLAMSPAQNLLGQMKSPGGKILGAIESLIAKKEE